MTAAVPETDKKWQAESDARTLIEAEEIKADKPRYRRALTKVKVQHKAATKTVNAARAVGKGK